MAGMAVSGMTVSAVTMLPRLVAVASGVRHLRRRRCRISCLVAPGGVAATRRVGVMRVCHRPFS